MRRPLVIFSIILLTVLCFHSCKSSKTSVADDGANVPNVALQELAESYTDWDTYSTSGKVSLSGAMSFSTSVQVKMAHGKCIAISIRPLLGIEVAKVFVNNDSAVVINKINRVYSTVKLEQFKNILPVSINTLQDIVLARPFTINDGTLSKSNIKKFNIAQAENGFIVSPRNTANNINYKFAINSNKQVKELIVAPQNSAQTYSAMYSDFVSENPGSEASNIRCDATLKGKKISMQLYLNPAKTKWDGVVDESASINSSYRKVTVYEFIDILKSMSL